jgi:hypothetical protein
MTNRNHGGGPADSPLEGSDAVDEMAASWQEFEGKLAAYLATMTDPAERDHLRIELADPDPEGDGGCPPYAQFAAFGDGQMIRAEVSGDVYLLPQYQLDEGDHEFFRGLGWSGNLEGGDIEDRNWRLVRPVASAHEIANHVTWAMRHIFGIVHPQLLSYEAWGPAADHIDVLGLCATNDIPIDEGAFGLGSGLPVQAPGVAVAVEPADREELLAYVASVLREKYECEPPIDDDGDFVLHHLGQPVWVRVRGDQPAVEIMARVAHDVHSRRATAVEIGLLNRDNLWVRWTLRDRTVWQTVVLPGFPFVPSHLDAMLDLFLEAMTSTRDDLAYRTGAKVA